MIPLWDLNFRPDSGQQMWFTGYGSPIDLPPDDTALEATTFNRHWLHDRYGFVQVRCDERRAVGRAYEHDEPGEYYSDRVSAQYASVLATGTLIIEHIRAIILRGSDDPV